jgi:hypothetical protein
MEEKPYIKKIDAFAKATGLEYYTNSSIKKHFVVHGNAFTKSEFIVFDLPNIDKNMHLVFSDSLSGRAAGASSSYCGLFLQIPNCKNEVKIRPRFLIDKITPGKRYKTGNSYTDKKVTIFKTTNESLPIKTDIGIIRKFIELHKAIGPLELVSVKNSLSHIPALHGNHWLAIMLDRRWELDTNKLKMLVSQGSELLLKAKKSS